MESRSPKQIIICIDYDGTFTKIPDLLTEFIKSAKKTGHVVICATMRHDNEEEAPAVRAAMDHLVDDIIFTGRQAKEKFLMDQNIHVDIWIDDQPFWIYRDAIV